MEGIPLCICSRNGQAMSQDPSTEALTPSPRTQTPTADLTSYECAMAEPELESQLASLPSKGMLPTKPKENNVPFKGLRVAA